MVTAWGQPTFVEAKGLEPSNLLTASQALYQLSYAPETRCHVTSLAWPNPPDSGQPDGSVEAREVVGALRPIP